jgi:hypothetical protein
MTIPPYNPNVPLVSNTIAEGQPSFLQNFGQLFAAFNTNHISLDDPTYAGNHNVIQLFEQSQGDTTQSQEIAIYSKKVAGQTDQLFMRYPSNGKEFQLTQYQIYLIGVTALQEAYFTTLPGGIIVYFGRVFSNGTTNFNISLNPSVCTNIIGVNIGVIGTPKQQPNVNLLPPTGGYGTLVISTLQPMQDNYYLIFGNI